MLKIIAASLLCAAIAMVAGLSVFFVVTAPVDPPPAISLDIAAARVDLGRVVSAGGVSQLLLDSSGLGVLLWTQPGLVAGDYPLLHLAFRQPPQTDALAVLWKPANGGGSPSHYRLPGQVELQRWQALTTSPDWQGKLHEFGLIFRGSPGQSVMLEKAQLLPPTTSNRLRLIYADWFAPLSWDHTSINWNWGAGSFGAAFFPVPVIAAFFCLSLLFYGAIVTKCATSRFDWQVVAGLFLFCWFALDVLWQGKFLGQLGETRRLFAGSDAEHKLAAGLDAALVKFATEVKRQVLLDTDRVFVSSDDDYFGMRTAYYLYPLNVFWQRPGKRLPARRYFHAGDYIVLLSPTSLGFEQKGGFLENGMGEVIPVTLIASTAVGALFRVI